MVSHLVRGHLGHMQWAIWSTGLRGLAGGRYRNPNLNAKYSADTDRYRQIQADSGRYRAYTGKNTDRYSRYCIEVGVAWRGIQQIQPALWCPHYRAFVPQS